MKVEFVRIASFRFEEELVCVVVGEYPELVFDARTVARSPAPDNAGEQRGVRKAGAENLVNSRVGVQDVAAFLHAAVLDCGCFGKK